MKKIFLQMTQEYLEEVILNFITLQVVRVRKNYTPCRRCVSSQKAIFARVFLPLLSQRERRDCSLP